MNRHSPLLAVLALVALSLTTFCQAEDCQQFLHSLYSIDPTEDSFLLTMVTMNKKGVASFTVTRIYYMPPKRLPSGGFKPAVLASLNANALGEQVPKFSFWYHDQVFSDRLSSEIMPLEGEDAAGIAGFRKQRFDMRQADHTLFEITDAPTVTVTITLKSWNNSKVSFVPTCDHGLLIGITPDVKYVIYLKNWHQLEYPY
jgi:hypothetical protein